MIRQLAWGTALAMVLTSNSWAGLTHKYTFEAGSLADSAGTLNVTLQGGATIQAGQLVLSGTNQYAELNGPLLNLPSYANGVTLEFWLTAQPAPANGGFSWTAGFGRPGDPADATTDPPEDPVGNDANEGIFGHNYLAVMPVYGGNDSRVAITDDYFNSETAVNGGRIRGTGQRHIVATVAPAVAPGMSTISYYRDGALVNSATGADNLSEVSNMFAYIGRSLYTNDPYFAGAINEFRIYDNALPLAQVQSDFTAGPTGPAGPTMTINRTTGEITLSNLNSTVRVTNYTISSAQGALNLGSWTPVAGRVDAPPLFLGSGDGTFDSDDLWGPGAVVSDSTTLYEETGVDGSGADDGAVLDSVSLGTGVWRKYYQEEVAANVRVRIDASTEVVMPLNIVYTGNGGLAYKRSDLNFDNVISGLDYVVLRTNIGTTLTPGQTDAQSYAFGDINGDQVVDFIDFRAFQADYVAAHGVAAFQALLASVPEPASASMALVGLVALMRRRRAV